MSEHKRHGRLATYDLLDALERNPLQIQAGADICGEAASTIKELEAKLGKAVEALHQLVIEYDEVDLAYDEPKSMTAAHGVAVDTLSELKEYKQCASPRR